MGHAALTSLDTTKLDGGTGSDTLNFYDSTLSSDYTLNLTIGGATNFENITGSNANEIINGDGNANTLKGYGGSDTISGLAGNDIIDGWRGLVKYFDDHKNYDLIYSKYFQNDMIHNDGIVLVKKIV